MCSAGCSPSSWEKRQLWAGSLCNPVKPSHPIQPSCKRATCAPSSQGSISVLQESQLGCSPGVQGSALQESERSEQAVACDGPLHMAGGVHGKPGKLFAYLDGCAEASVK